MLKKFVPIMLFAVMSACTPMQGGMMCKCCQSQSCECCKSGDCKSCKDMKKGEDCPMCLKHKKHTH